VIFALFHCLAKNLQDFGGFYSFCAARTAMNGARFSIASKERDGFLKQTGTIMFVHNASSEARDLHIDLDD